MNALSYSAASRCENATHPRCRCRCGGTLHGAKRGRVEELPADDPHHAERPPEDPQTSILDELEDFVRRGVAAQRAVDAILEGEEAAP